MRRSLIEEASQHHLLLHTGQLEALTCPATIMHRYGGAVELEGTGAGLIAAAYTAQPPSCTLLLSRTPPVMKWRPWCQGALLPHS